MTGFIILVGIKVVHVVYFLSYKYNTYLSNIVRGVFKKYQGWFYF